MKLDKVVGRRTKPPEAENLRRHNRKCFICKHPQRAEIEHDFLLWRNPHEIVTTYNLPHYSTIYRHAHALGLSRRRNENVRTVLDSLIEKAESAPVTGNTVIRAIRAYSCIDDRGHWTDLPKNVIYESRRVPNQESAPATKDSVPVPASSDDPKPADFLIANTGLENAATR
jgi:hypothetical protein